MTRTELPNTPREHLAIDWLGLLNSKDYILAVVDYYSRYMESVIAIHRRRKAQSGYFGVSLADTDYRCPYRQTMLLASQATSLNLTCRKTVSNIGTRHRFGRVLMVKLNDRIGHY